MFHCDLWFLPFRLHLIQRSILAEAHNPWVVQSKVILILHSSQLQLQNIQIFPYFNPQRGLSLKCAPGIQTRQL